MILLTGATGTTGSATVDQLRAARIPFRLMSRDVARARAQFGDGLEYVEGDFARPETLDAAFDGFAAVITPGRWNSLVALTNYTGHPTLTLRAAVVNGRPRSVTLVGRLYEEGRLISLGMALERRLDVRDLRPPID